MKFFRQYSIVPFILDFYSTRLKLAIELDGGHHAEDDRREYDKNRTEYLKAYGIEVLRFWNNEVMNNIDGGLELVRRKIDR